jgi:hypothetical protein
LSHAPTDLGKAKTKGSRTKSWFLINRLLFGWLGGSEPGPEPPPPPLTSHIRQNRDQEPAFSPKKKIMDFFQNFTRTFGPEVPEGKKKDNQSA